MKTVLASALLLALAVSPTFAHLGETVSECETRYGKPVFTNKEFRHYEKDGIIIAITFDAVQPDAASDAATNREMKGRQAPAQSRAVAVIYSPQQDHTYFSSEEIKALFAANTGPNTPPPGVETWKPVQHKRTHEDYLRFDNLASARVYWKYVGDSNVAKRIKFQAGPHLSAETEEEKHPESSGDKLNAIGKDF